MIGQSAGKSYAYLLGVYLGDGCVTYTGSVEYKAFRLNTIDRDFAEATVDALEAVTGKRPNIRAHAVKKGRDNHAITLTAPILTDWLEWRTDKKRELPLHAIKTWNRDEQLALVAGLMDSEGFVGANSNPTNRRYYLGFKSCDAWVPDFIVLLQSLGIKIGKVQTESPYKEGYKAPTRFTIKMQSWIDAGGYFNIRRKQQRVEEWAAAGAYERRATNPRRLTSESIRPEAA